MAEPTPAFGQSVALADEIVAGLNAATTFCLEIEAVRRFVRKTELADLPRIDDPVQVDVFPGMISSERNALDGVYTDTYGIHVIMQQVVADATNGGLSEAQVALLLQLQSEIVEFLCARLVTAPFAVHPFSGARVVAVRQGDDGIYSLPRLEEHNAFYCDTILTYRMAGLRRTA